MTVKYFAILTSQGAARLANAAALGVKLNITQMAIGDGGGELYTPEDSQTKLKNQLRIAPLNMLSIDPKNASQIIAEQIIPENEGGYTTGLELEVKLSDVEYSSESDDE
ncbi:phage tail protein [Escherichia coli]|nr:phage tail protein [Escherichia coli]